MQYLAEVKKQTKGFISGLKTEFKLLACQHNDQTWSAVPGDEVIVTEEVNYQVGEGALLILTLASNRQIQGFPELAGAELVRQLQKLSRLSEKIKDQREEVEQWKQSLTYQSQELSRREMEMEGRLEQLEEMEGELQTLERRRHELENSWESLQQQQEQLSTLQSRLGYSTDLDPQQASKLESLIGRLCTNGDGADSFWQEIHQSRQAANCQQTILETYWQQLSQQKTQVQQRQSAIEKQRETLHQRQQELISTRTSLEQAKIQLNVQRTVLASKQDLLGHINLDLQTKEALQYTLQRLANGLGDTQQDSKVDLEALENMPLGELETIVKNLQADLDNLICFVNDQEEELTLQCQAVQALQEQLKTANAYDRLKHESDLGEEQERKGMLDETLVGQRRNLRERQSILSQYVRVLRRRQGAIAIDENIPRINLDPIILQLEELQNNAEEERQRLETEIEHLQQSLRQIEEMMKQQETEQQTKAKALQIEEETWQQARGEVMQLQIRLSIYEEALQPLQDSLTEIRQRLDNLAQWLNPTAEEQHFGF